MKMAPILNTQTYTTLPFLCCPQNKITEAKISNENYMLKLIIMKINFTFLLFFFLQKNRIRKKLIFAPQICFLR